MVRNNHLGPMLTVNEVAQLLHVHPNTVRRFSNRGLLRVHRISPRGDRRFRREDVVRFLDELNMPKEDQDRASSTEK